MSVMKRNQTSIYSRLPETPGVYIMKDSKGGILYIGKAGNLKRRVSSYFTRPHDVRIEKLVSKIRDIAIRKTDTTLEALILESSLIKHHEPPFNIKEKDDKSFLYIEITEETYPRVRLVRGKDKEEGKRFGPFTSAGSAREAYKILRRIFPWNIHPSEGVGKFKRPCFDYEVSLCPGTCVGLVGIGEYTKTISRLELFLSGRKKTIIRDLKQEMKEASRGLEFEKADKLKRQLFALQHIQDVALIYDDVPLLKDSSQKRIEGYDISAISGTSAVGVMVVFKGEKPEKSEYRKFIIRSFSHPDDVGMMLEVLERRFRNAWTRPDLILVDGGKGQVNGAKALLKEMGIVIPVLGIAKGPKRKRNDFFGNIPGWTDSKTLIRARDEAHRFAITFHRKIRGAKLIGK